MSFPGYLISVGSSGSVVRDIQQQLNTLGYNAGTADGIFGPGTESAVIRFQELNNLNPDGIIGKLTWDRLFSNEEASLNQTFPGYLIAEGSSGDHVRAIQRQLNNLGYSAGAADGIFGQGTKNAVISFQSNNFLDQDGIVGQATWNVLFQGSSKGVEVTFPGSILAQGSSGEAVKQVQNQLNRLGFNVGVADGIFGPGTNAGVKLFQEKYNLSIDGIVGQQTWTKLMSASSSGEEVNNNTPFSGTNLAEGSRGEEVRILQYRLNELQYFVGTVDGIFGPATNSEVRKFQEDQGLSIDGIVGRLTWDALFRNSTNVVNIPYPNVLLVNGSTGDHVLRIQQRLQRIGYNIGTPDGVFGTRTEQGVRNFQSRANLQADGIVGRLTWDALFNGLASTPSKTSYLDYPGTLLQEGSQGSDVQTVQSRLSELGYNAGTPDGIFGPMTRRSVEAFQHDYGLGVDGIVGSMTWTTLFSSESRPREHTGGAPNPVGSIRDVRKIFIDAGHGGFDPGAVANNLREKDIVLTISQIQRRALEAAGYTVRMSRTSDEYLTLSERAQRANDWGADIFISNHVNAGGGRGSEVFHSIYGGDSETLAKAVAQNLSSIFNDRGPKSRQGQNGDYYAVIRETNMPAILVEHGFIDNYGDSLLLHDPNKLEGMAMATVNAIKALSPINSSNPDEDQQFKPTSIFARLFNVDTHATLSSGISISRNIGGVRFTYEAQIEKEGSVNWNVNEEGLVVEDLLDAFSSRGITEILSWTKGLDEDSLRGWTEKYIFDDGNIEEIRTTIGEVKPDWRNLTFTIPAAVIEVLSNTGYKDWKIREKITFEGISVSRPDLQQATEFAKTMIVVLAVITVGVIIVKAGATLLVPATLGAALIITVLFGGELIDNLPEIA